MRTLVPGQEGPYSLLTESGVALSLQGVEEGTGEPFDELLWKGWKKVRAGRQLQSSLLKDALSRKNRRELMGAVRVVKDRGSPALHGRGRA